MKLSTSIFRNITLLLVLAAGTASAATYQDIEIKDVNVKHQGEVATVSPGETFGVSLHYEFTKPSIHGCIIQIMVGYEGIGAQTCIANALIWGNKYYDHHPLYFRGQWHDISKKTVQFAMKAPEEPGTYEIRFRNGMAYLPHEALEYWTPSQGSPPEEATIATIIVE